MTYSHVRVFLDANVLFSASYDSSSRFLLFWKMIGVAPVTSLYAIGEVRKHLRRPGHSERFNMLLPNTQIISAEDLRFIPAGVDLAEKDRPILASAIAASVEYLVTGDARHFGTLYGQKIAGVLILPPADFLLQHGYRLGDW